MAMQYRPIVLFFLILLALPFPSEGGAAAGPSLSADLVHQASILHAVLKKRKKPTKPAAVPAVIQDVQVISHQDHTRLIFYLPRSVPFTQSRQAKPERVVIKLHNSLLGQTALTRLNEEGFPPHVTVTQTNHAGPHAVFIALDLHTIGNYKLVPLNRPSRLIVELFPRAAHEDQAIASPPEVAVLPKSIPLLPHAEINTIVLDPGHGGKDPGAIGRGGTAEKDITLQVSLLLRDLIEKQLGKQVLLTRDRDIFVELEDRAKFANSHEADLFVSIHVNAHPQRATKGLEVYHFGEATDPRALAVAARENGTPIEQTGMVWQHIVADLLTSKKMEQSLELAWTIKQALVRHLDTHYDVVDHGIKTGPFYVLRFTAMPSILAEIAFISNSTEERLMQGTAFLGRIAEGLLEGIKAFIVPPTAPPSVPLALHGDDQAHD
jgi:N-acetylmuramoyl-L-alanine amidase